MNLDINKTEIDRNKVLKFLGYGAKKPPAIILKKLEQELEKIEDLLKVELLLKRLDIVEVTDKTVLLEGGIEIESSYAAEELCSASSVYATIYTVGNRIEEKIAEHSNGSEMIRAMILDKIGIVALDCVKEKIKETIAKETGELKISAELYPAQSDFEISNQRLIYDLFKDENSSISINESNQLSPIKTVAMIFGIGEHECSYRMCDRCDSKCGV